MSLPRSASHPSYDLRISSSNLAISGWLKVLFAGLSLKSKCFLLMAFHTLGAEQNSISFVFSNLRTLWAKYREVAYPKPHSPGAIDLQISISFAYFPSSTS